MKRLALSVLALSTVSPLMARAEANEEHPFKVTVGEYRYSGGGDGHDLNLRWRHSDTDVWIGAYRDPVFGIQTRAGVDTSLPLRGSATLQPSLQVASGGFVGAIASGWA